MRILLAKKSIKLINIFYFSYITTDKFYIEPNGKSEVLVIDRISQEVGVQGKKQK